MRNVGIMLLLLLVTVVATRIFFPRIVTEDRSTVMVKIQRDTIRDTLWRKVEVPKIVISPIDTIYIPADTAELIERYKTLWHNYYSKLYYSETFSLDTLGEVTVNAKVTQNKLDSLGIEYNLVRPTIHITEKVLYTPSTLYIGGRVGKETLSPMLMYNRKNKYSYLLEYNINRNEVSAGMLINIKSW